MFATVIFTYVDEQKCTAEQRNSLKKHDPGLILFLNFATNCFLLPSKPTPASIFWSDDPLGRPSSHFVTLTTLPSAKETAGLLVNHVLICMAYLWTVWHRSTVWREFCQGISRSILPKPMASLQRWSTEENKQMAEEPSFFMSPNLSPFL